MGLLEDLAAPLVTANLGQLGQNLFLGWLPDIPDAAIVLHETSGFAPLYTHNALTPAIERPGLQVMVRDVTYAEAHDRMRDVYDVLCGLTDYLSLQPVQMPAPIGRDERNRPLFSVNFVLSIPVAEV